MSNRIFRVILEGSNDWQFWVVLSNLCPFGQFWPFQAVLDHSRPFWSIWTFFCAFGPFFISLGFLVLFTLTILCQYRPFWRNWAFWAILDLYGIFRHSWPFEPLFAILGHWAISKPDCFYSILSKYTNPKRPKWSKRLQVVQKCLKGQRTKEFKCAQSASK